MKTYTAARALMKKASDEIAAAKKDVSLLIEFPGPRPLTFYRIPPDLYPKAQGDPYLLEFDAEVQKRALAFSRA